MERFDLYGKRWNSPNQWRLLDALIDIWDDEHPRDRAIWVSGDPLDPTFGEAALEVDLKGMPPFLDDQSYGGAHRYTLQPGEENIPPSRFRHIPQEEIDTNPDHKYWSDRSSSSKRC